MYRCLNCSREVKLELSTAKKIICPFCGFRIIKKTRPRVIKKVMAV